MTLLNETRLSLIALAKQENINSATAWRWATKGVRGVKLETIIIGGRRMTSHEAFGRFIATINGTEAEPAKPSRTNRQRETAIDAAEKELTAAGI